MNFKVFVLIVLFIAFHYVKSFAGGHVDPQSLKITSAENPIVLDGVLDETDWARRYDYLQFGAGFEPGDVSYGVTGFEAVDGEHLDSTTTIVKILHYGLDLYIGIQSNDKYVNKWGGSWEGDGLFMKINTANGVAKEIKFYFNASGVNPDIVLETNIEGDNAIEGAAFKPEGTIVNDTTQVDSGFTAELVIHLEDLGYSDEYAEVPVLINVFDPDGQTGTAGEEFNVGSYYKTWWGSQWGPDMRNLILADPPLVNAYSFQGDVAIDGQLSESIWETADSINVGKNSKWNTGGYYMQWGDTLNSYDDPSNAVIKFFHKGTDLYVGVRSDDSSICKWSPGWEADGLFLWMTYKGVVPGPGDRIEIKAMYFNEEENASAVLEFNANAPTGCAEMVSHEHEGSVSHSDANGSDHGYSLEMVIHTDQFGYSEGDTVKLSSVIWDIDHASSNDYSQEISDLACNWWGTQWVDPNFEKFYMYRNVFLSPNGATGLNENGRTGMIKNNIELKQNYPNPFNPNTMIEFTIGSQSLVRLDVYNLIGEKVRRLLNENLTAGNHQVEWNGCFDNGMKASSGIYFYKLITDNGSESKTMLLMK